MIQGLEDEAKGHLEMHIVIKNCSENTDIEFSPSVLGQAVFVMEG